MREGGLAGDWRRLERMLRVSLLLLLLALSACGTTAPTPRSAPDVESPPITPVAPSRSETGGAPETMGAPETTNLHELLAFDAVDEMLRGHLLLAVDPGSRMLRARDVDSGEELWRVELGEASEGALIEDLGDGRILVQVPGQDFHTIDLARGVRIARRSSPPQWNFVQRVAGACALMSDCALQPISCQDGAALGPRLRGTTISYTPMGPDEDGSPTCTSPLEVLGRAGELSLYVVHVRESEHAEVIAIDRAGEVSWRSADVACEQCGPVAVGSASDGSVCWTTSTPDRERVVRAFRCADGHPLFTRRITLASGYRHPPLFTGWVTRPPGLFLTGDTEATLIAPDGRARWTRPTAPDTLVLPAGLRTPSYPLGLDRYTSVEHVDPANGRTTREQSLEGGEVRVDEEGVVAIVPMGQSSDRAGAPVPALRVFTFHRARNGSDVSLDGRVVLALPGDAHVVGERTTETGTRLVVAEERPGQPDRVHVLRASPTR